MATNEVILSAGTMQSPQILELSGIGDPSVMNPLGISTVVSLPGVGNNLQDHPAVVVVNELAPGYESLDTLGYNSTAFTAVSFFLQTSLRALIKTHSSLFLKALSAYSLGQGILTQVTYVLAYLTPKLFLSSTDQKSAINLLGAINTGISLTQLAQQVYLYLAGVPMIELLSVNV